MNHATRYKRAKIRVSQVATASAFISDWLKKSPLYQRYDWLMQVVALETIRCYFLRCS